MSYHIGTGNLVAIPLYVRHNIQFKDGGAGKLELQMGTKQNLGKGVRTLISLEPHSISLFLQLEAVVIEIAMPKTVLNVNLTTSQGKYSFDTTSKLMTWEVGRLETGKLPTVKGNIVLQSGVPLPDSNPTILVKFTINQCAISGLKVNRLDMFGEVCY